MTFDQDLCLNLWYELNPRVRCAFGNVFIPFPFPKCHFTDGNHNGNWNIARERYQTSNIISLLYISWSNFYWGGKPLQRKWKSSMLLDYIITTSCPSTKSEKTNGRERRGKFSASVCLPWPGGRQEPRHQIDISNLDSCRVCSQYYLFWSVFDILRKLLHWYFRDLYLGGRGVTPKFLRYGPM